MLVFYYFFLFKDTQLQFVEVRVCRLVHYLMDRREIGMTVLNEILAMYLEFSCQHDLSLIQEINEVVIFYCNLIHFIIIFFNNVIVLNF